MIEEMQQAYLKNNTFRDYVDAGMKMYNRTFDEMLKDKITEAYYRSLLQDGCNWKGDQSDDERIDIQL